MAYTVLMTSGPGGSIVGFVINMALGRDQQVTASARDEAVSRAVLDENELRAVEYASMGLPEPVAALAPRPKRSLLRRIFGR